MVKIQPSVEANNFLSYAINHITTSDRIKYIKTIPFKTGDGVSCIILYPDSILYKPRKNGKGEIDEVMLIKMMVYGEDVTRKQIDIDISKLSQSWNETIQPRQYIDDPACEGKASNFYKPVNMRIYSIGFFDAQNELIYNDKGQITSLTDLILDAIELHLAPTYRIKGALFRLRKKGWIFRKSYLSFFEKVFLFFLRVLGKSMSEPADIRSIIEFKVYPYLSQLESNGAREIQLYGYSIPLSVVFIVSCTTLAMSFYLPEKTNIITGTTVFLVLAIIFNEAIPRVLRLFTCNIRKVLGGISEPIPCRIICFYL